MTSYYKVQESDLTYLANLIRTQKQSSDKLIWPTDFLRYASNSINNDTNDLYHIQFKEYTLFDGDIQLTAQGPAAMWSSELNEPVQTVGTRDYVFGVSIELDDIKHTYTFDKGYPQYNTTGDYYSVQSNSNGYWDENTTCMVQMTLHDSTLMFAGPTFIGVLFFNGDMVGEHHLTVGLIAAKNITPSEVVTDEGGGVK